MTHEHARVLVVEHGVGVLGPPAFDPVRGVQTQVVPQPLYRLLLPQRERKGGTGLGRAWAGR